MSLRAGAHEVALVIAAAGVVTVLVVGSRTRDVKLAMQAGLELWTAAGLLALTADGAWRTLAISAAVIGIRKLASRGLVRAA